MITSTHCFICLAVYVSVLIHFSVGLLKNYWTDFYKTWWKGGTHLTLAWIQTKEQMQDIFVHFLQHLESILSLTLHLLPFFDHFTNEPNNNEGSW